MFPAHPANTSSLSFNQYTCLGICSVNTRPAIVLLTSNSPDEQLADIVNYPAPIFFSLILHSLHLIYATSYEAHWLVSIHHWPYFQHGILYPINIPLTRTIKIHIRVVIGVNCPIYLPANLYLSILPIYLPA